MFPPLAHLMYPPITQFETRKRMTEDELYLRSLRAQRQRRGLFARLQARCQQVGAVPRDVARTVDGRAYGWPWREWT
jgi:hypothetical protein